MKVWNESRAESGDDMSAENEDEDCSGALPACGGEKGRSRTECGYVCVGVVVTNNGDVEAGVCCFWFLF